MTQVPQGRARAQQAAPVCPLCVNPVRSGRRYCSPSCAMKALNRSPEQRERASARMKERLSDPAKRAALGAAIRRGHLGHVPLDLRPVHHRARKCFGRAEADRIIAAHLAAEKRRACT